MHWRRPTGPLLLALAALLVAPRAAAAQCAVAASELSSPDPGVGDAFGSAVSLDDELLAVGALGDDEGGLDAGALYVFARQGAGFALEAKLVASDAGTTRHLGRAVSCSGPRVLVGATHDFLQVQGAVYVFQRTSPSWQQAAKLVASDGAPADRFGWTVALDGDTAAVGAVGDATMGNATGAVYVFERSGATWVETQKLLASDAKASALFGSSLALDGDRLVVGSHRSTQGAFLSGAAYVFERGASGWVETAKLVQPSPGTAHEAGRAVGLSGETIAMGVPGDDGAALNAGAVLMFDHQGSDWVLQQELTAPDATADARFGTALALDGGALAIGAPDADAGDDRGAVYVYERQGPFWFALGRLDAPVVPGDHLGESVALNGAEVAAGARYRAGPVSDAGAAFHFAGVLGPVARYCTAAPNSVGGGAHIAHAGSTSLAAADLALIVHDAVPGQPGVFYYGAEAVLLPFGDGYRCVANGARPVLRLAPALVPDFVGDAFLPLDFDRPPLGRGPGEVTAGSTWNFQFYYRDPAGPGGSGFNLSDALAITFCP